MFLIRVTGKWACFTRPELKAEGITYEVMTPSAARGLLESIYWKPEMKWVIKGLHVLKPVKTTTLMRNCISSVVSVRSVLNNKQKPIDVTTKTERDQRNATVLRDVDYVIEADIIAEKRIKHVEIFRRRVNKGQCFQHPYFGCREFAVDSFTLEKSIPPSPLKGKKELGYMLHSIDYDNGAQPVFFDAVMEEGYIKVPEKGLSHVHTQTP